MSGRTCESRATAWDGGISPGTRRMSVCWGDPFFAPGYFIDVKLLLVVKICILVLIQPLLVDYFINLKLLTVVKI
jgi:hypothetical protein